MTPTPGPWKVMDRPSSGLNIEWGDDDKEVRPICHMRWSDGLNHARENRIKADAQLIAAVPDLLCACRQVAEMEKFWSKAIVKYDVYQCQSFANVMADVREAIRKATSQQ